MLLKRVLVFKMLRRIVKFFKRDNFNHFDCKLNIFFGNFFVLSTYCLRKILVNGIKKFYIINHYIYLCEVICICFNENRFTSLVI